MKKSDVDPYKGLKVLGIALVSLIAFVAIISRNDPARTIKDINRDAKIKAWQDSIIWYEGHGSVTKRELALRDSIKKYDPFGIW